MHVDKLGVFTFKTGIGFLCLQYSCYVLEDIDELIDFQNEFKEFERGKQEVLLEESLFFFKPISDFELK